MLQSLHWMDLSCSTFQHIGHWTLMTPATDQLDSCWLDFCKTVKSDMQQWLKTTELWRDVHRGYAKCPQKQTRGREGVKNTRFGDIFTKKSLILLKFFHTHNAMCIFPQNLFPWHIHVCKVPAQWLLIMLDINHLFFKSYFLLAAITQSDLLSPPSATAGVCPPV